MGCAPGWEEAPYDNGARWGINDVHKVAKQTDLAIDCHNLKRVMKGKETLGRRSIEEVREHLKLVKKKELPMLCTTEFKNIPSIKRYPIEDVIKRFGSDYFSSGIDYAIAYALYKGFTAIHLYGILLCVTQDEYFAQKPSVEHWAGIAIGMGVEFKVHDSTAKKRCTLFKTKFGNLYGFNIEQKNPMYVFHDKGR